MRVVAVALSRNKVMCYPGIQFLQAPYYSIDSRFCVYILERMLENWKVFRKELQE